MSRSNPQTNAPNPAVRWFEWNGEDGSVRYYDKDAKQNVEVGSDFTFLLLDRMATIGGWHDPSKSGIYSNEVRDTRQDVMLVKAFKAPGPLAEGLYKDIKDRVHTVGGYFVANCYIAFKHNGGLSIGSIKFKGSALGAWMAFEKTHRDDIDQKAIRIHGFTEGKKGKVTFRVPVFTVADVSESTNKQAVGLDAVLQVFLTGYLKRNTRDQVEQAAPTSRDGEEPPPDYEGPHEPPHAITEDDIPF